MSDDERLKLGKFLQSVAQQCERDNKKFFDCIETWWNWYEAKPKTERRQTPWPGASNVVIPLIRIHSDAVKARLINTIFGAPDLWTFRTWNEETEETARQVTEFLNWAADDNEFDIYTPASSWIDEAVVLGSGVMGLNWTTRKRYVFWPGEGGKPRAVPVEVGRGPQFRHWPRDQVMWQYGKSIQDAEYLFTSSPSTWGDLSNMEQFDEIDAGYAEKCSPEGHGTMATRAIKRAIADSAGQDETDELYDIRQAWVEWPVLRGLKFESLDDAEVGTPRVPLLVTFDRTSGTVLRARGKPYYTQGWPFYEAKVRTSAGHRNPAGMAKMLEPFQRGATQTFNQSVDTITFANSVAGFTTDPKMVGTQFIPGQYRKVDTLDSVREAVHGKIVAPDISLINMMFSMAERETGINDPSLGREIRYGGHPSPATSTALMLQESKELLRTTTQQLRLEFSRMAEDVATLYQQFESKDSGKIERAIGTVDGTVVKQWLIPTTPLFGQIGFDLKAMTEQTNPEAEREKAIFTMQATGSFGTQILQLMQVAYHPNTPPPMAKAALGMIEILTEAFKEVLNAAQVDDIRKYMLKLQEFTANAPGQLDQLAALAQQQQAGANPQPGQLGPAGGQQQLQPVPPLSNGQAGPITNAGAQGGI